MALLDVHKFSATSKNKNNIHQPTKAKYTVFDIKGCRIFQIDTYGTNNRENPEKISQSIQIDREMAKTLVEKLNKTFNL